MKQARLLRSILVSVAPVLPITGLMALCLVAAPEPATKKTPPFPLSLWAQATADDYVPDQACVDCHQDAHSSFERSPHAPYVRNPRDPVDKQGCQSCHGPGGPHIAHLEEPDEIRKYILSYKTATPAQGAMACLRCHNDVMTEAHWRRTGHAQANVGCVSCHYAHQEGDVGKTGARAGGKGRLARSAVFTAVAEPKKLLRSDEATLCGTCHQSDVGEFRHNFHHPVPEGRMICSDCHGIHPRREAEKQRAAGHARLRVAPDRQGAEMCATCHADTAGPFVFEHDPVAGLTGEGCLECHRAHGSHNPKLLSSFSRGLCSQCHTDKLNNHFPGRTCWQSGCHVAVHGSNTDRLLLRR